MTSRNRPILRFSIRAMLVLLAAFGIWFGLMVRRAHRQRAAVKWVRDNGGEVGYDWQADGEATGPPGPKWMLRLVGDEFFQSVEGVIFEDVHLDDFDLSELANFERLRFLYINMPVSDLAPIRGLRHLEKLFIFKVRVNNLSPLTNLTNLKTLVIRCNFWEDGFTKVDLSPLAQLINLESLTIKGTLNTDEEIAKLQEALPDCEIDSYMAGITVLNRSVD